MTEGSFYDRVGGRATFEQLVREFYKGVASDPPLRALYPEEDLGPAEERTRMFLEQYWGGPKTYSEQRGHPRLRIRHNQFKVTPKQAERWMRHMSNAIDTLSLSPDDEQHLRAYLSRTAQAMINSPED
ncbi:MAG: globin [Propionibacteriaceae bacterium]|nr:globin [Propionibacteriaceae bacterium]